MIGKTLEHTMTNLLAMEKAERINFATANKKALLEQKKSEIIKSMPISFYSSLAKDNEYQSKGESLKNSNTDVITKTIVGNVCMYMDGHLDVQGEGCWKKSLQESQSKFYHTQDHSNKTRDRVGKPQKTYTSRIDLKRLGIRKNEIKDAECLLMETDIYKILNEKIFTQYNLGMINQHSVGMLYVKIDMAVNDDSEETKEEYALWNKIYPKIINKDVADKYGMFFYVSESKLIEISAVTRGSNDLTPTLEDKYEPSNDTHKTNEAEAAKALQETNKNNFYKNAVK